MSAEGAASPVMTLTGELAECLQESIADARAAHLQVQALTELLHGCDVDHKLSAGLFVGLLDAVQGLLDNAVEGMAVVQARAPLN